MTTIEVDSARYAELPRSIRALITEAAEIGGRVDEIKPRLFEFVLPRRVMGGEIRMTARGTVGYYVSGGKNVVRGVGAVRSEIAYWGKQARV